MRFSSPPIAVDRSTDPPTAKISAIVFAYNQEDLVLEAAKSVLAQTILPEELILSDDHSPDGTLAAFHRLAKEYSGPTKIKIRRNASNLRLAGHINAAVAEASHDWILPHAGDDVSHPERLEKMLGFQAKNPHAPFIWSDVDILTWDGCKEAVDTSFIRNPGRIGWDYGCGPSQIWHKDLFRFFGPLPRDVIAEDIVLPFRASLIGSKAFLPEPLVHWRIRPAHFSKTPHQRAQYACDHRCSAAACQAQDLAFFLQNEAAPSRHLSRLLAKLKGTPSKEKIKLRITLLWISLSDWFHPFRRRAESMTA